VGLVSLKAIVPDFHFKKFWYFDLIFFILSKTSSNTAKQL